MSYFLKKISFKEDHRCFSKGDEICFREGVNLIVGDQGSGKSTLYELLSGETYSFEKEREKLRKRVLSIDCEEVGSCAFDFEGDNPRTRAGVMSGELAVFQVASKFCSHGECQNTILEGFQRVSDNLILLDEPDTSLSPRSCVSLARNLQKVAEERNCQLLVMCHNPLLFMSQEEVFSLESREWISGAEYLQSHLNSLKV